MKNIALVALALALAGCADFSTDGDWQKGEQLPGPSSPVPTATPPDDGLEGLVVNEFLLITPSGEAVGDDTNHDGVLDDGDRFIEIVNDTGGPIELSTIQIEVDYGNATLSTPLDQGTLPHGKAVLVFGGVTVPASAQSCGALIQADKLGTVSPNDGSMSVVLSTPNSSVAVGWTFFSNAAATRGPDLSGGWQNHPATMDPNNVTRTNSAGCKSDWTPF